MNEERKGIANNIKLEVLCKYETDRSQWKNTLTEEWHLNGLTRKSTNKKNDGWQRMKALQTQFQRTIEAIERKEEEDMNKKEKGMK